MTKDELKPILEALIFAADHPLSLDRLSSVLEGEKRDAIRDALKELIADYANNKRGFYIEEAAGGWQIRTHAEYAPWIRRLFNIGMQRLTRPALETLAIAAYKQPITRAELENIRGVDSSGVLRTLLEKRLIKIVGRKDEPGRPVVYGTTKEFLETFSLKDLSGLPTLKDIDAVRESLGEDYAEKDYAGEDYAGKDDAPENNAPGNNAQENNAPGNNKGTAAEDNIQGRDSVEKKSRGTDPSGQGQGQP